MRRRSKLLQQVLMMLVSVGCAFVPLQSVSGFAPQSNPANAQDEIGKTLERCLVEVEHLHAICKTARELKTIEERAQSAEKLLAIYRIQIEQQTALNQTRASIDVLTAARLADLYTQLKSYEGRLAENKVQIAELKRERSRLRRMRNIFGGLAVALGIGIGFALSN